MFNVISIYGHTILSIHGMKEDTLVATSGEFISPQPIPKDIIPIRLYTSELPLRRI